MKIAHVQVIPHLSGAQQVSFDILSSLNNNSNDLYMICGELTESSKDFIEAFSSINVKIIEVKNLKRDIGSHDIYAFSDLYSVFKKNNFDIVHTNSTKPAILARISARLAGCKKIVHTVHGIAFHTHVSILKRIFFYLIEIFSLYFGHKNISVNNYYRKFYPLVKTITVYNGIDFSTFDRKCIQKDYKDKINFAFFARLDDQKNPLDFIYAVHLLDNKGILDGKNIYFTLAGDGELKKECEQLIKQLDLESKIKMEGWISDKNAFLNTVDVICQPSKWEAFGLVFIEAAYFGIPAIATKVEGIPEVVIDGETGLLYDGGAMELSLCILNLINNPSLIEKLGENARTRALKEFTKQKMIEKYHQVYFE